MRAVSSHALDGPQLAQLGVSTEARRFALWLTSAWGWRGCTWQAQETLAREWGCSARTVRRYITELVSAGVWRVAKARGRRWAVLLFLGLGTSGDLSPIGQLADSGREWSINGSCISSARLLELAESVAQAGAAGGLTPFQGQLPYPGQPARGVDFGGQVVGNSAARAPGGHGYRSPVTKNTGHGCPPTNKRLEKEQQQSALAAPGLEGALRAPDAGEPRATPAAPPERTAAAAAAGARGAPPAARRPKHQRAARVKPQAARELLSALEPLGLDASGLRAVSGAIRELAAVHGLEPGLVAREAAAWAWTATNPAGALRAACSRAGGYLDQVLERRASAAGLERAHDGGTAGSTPEEDPVVYDRRWNGALETAVLHLVHAKQSIEALSRPHSGNAESAAERAMERSTLESRLDSIRARLGSLLPRVDRAGLDDLARALEQHVRDVPADVEGVAYAGGLDGWRAAADAGKIEAIAAWAEGLQPYSGGAPELVLEATA